MADLFVDTSGWVCHFDRAQPQHAEATGLIVACASQGRRLVTTNYVVCEVVSLLTSRRRVPRRKMIECVDALLSWDRLEVVHVDRDLATGAWTLLKDRADKHWSLVDCASFVIMQQRGLGQALTSDRHFEQAGFDRLLSS